MFLESLISKVKNKLWIYFLPSFISKSKASIETYNYYSVYFSDVKQEKYVLSKVIGKSVVLEKWNKEIKSYSTRESFSITELEMMNAEIVHWVKNGPLRFDSILSFSINYFTRIAYIKSSISRTKSRISSKLHNNDEMIGLDRVNLLHMLINEYVNQAPDKTHIGVTSDEIIDMIYGHLWRNYIKNEDFRRKTLLLLQSFIITGDVKYQDGRYYVQGQAIATILAWQSEEKKEKQQIRSQKNISRLMLIITASTLIITLAILAQAGIVNLHSLWGHIKELGPFRLLFKLI
ncbi:hypothetical protein HV337_10975 [Citrobacter freundii]|uniref:hypothetical protein n=1 Tax=Citrobacter freundii TaxID=546 RepID=UPI0015EA5050|nr:hypothetical protein [Citrobacter freundii]QLR73025.1 hypothetical protein HV337_10975 [Citrobacter freundii]QLY52190.1 hypothetical protein HV186_10720 [Citrobacter freundii]